MVPSDDRAGAALVPRRRLCGKQPAPCDGSAAGLTVLPTAEELARAKRRRIRGKQASHAASPDDFAEKFVALATAEEMAHPDAKFAGAGLRRTHVHWTHGRSANPDHVQPDAMTRKEFWLHLCKCYREVYPDESTPTGSILCFGLVAEEQYSVTPAGTCPTHKHAPTFSSDKQYWNKIAKHSLTRYSVKLNAVAHDSYSDMYAYVRTPTAKKPLHLLDANPYFSVFHPQGEALSKLLASAGKAARLNSSRWALACGGEQPKVMRDRVPRIFEVVKQHGLESVTALKAHAQKEATEGRTALAELCTKYDARLQSFLDAALSVTAAPAKLLELTGTRLDKLARAASSHPCRCGGVWVPGALRILGLNGIDVGQFCGAVCRALQFGAVRGVNVGCVGVGGCGKSTLIEPLEYVFEVLGKPQRGSTFPLGRLPGCDVILWQDFEHHEGTVAFADLLSLFVGESVEIRTPSQLNKKHRNVAPLFYSGRVPLQCKRSCGEEQMELNKMMAERFTTFEFNVPLPKPERRADWTHCGKCCAAFYLHGSVLGGFHATAHLAPGAGGAPSSSSVHRPPPASVLAAPCVPAPATIPEVASAAALWPTPAPAPATSCGLTITTAGGPSRLAAPLGSLGSAPASFPATTARAGFGPTAAAGTGPGVVAALLELKAMLDSGHLTAAEYQAAKRQLLGV